MITWRDPVQRQMLLDGLNFSNNSIIKLSREFLNSSKAEAIIYASVANRLELPLLI
jgi:hypothetical protein